jgi:membrane protease YdiL (CAAX protease family)
VTSRRPLLPLWLAWCLVLLLALLLNLFNNELLARWYIVTGPVGAGLLLAVARAAGVTWSDLGLARRTWRVGLAWAGSIIVLVTSAYAAVAVFPPTRGLFEDDRVGADSLGALLFAVLVRIPFGTVLLEETLFRGVLLGLGARTMGWWRSAVVSSALFGLWHVLPARGAADSNPGVIAVVDAGGGFGVPLAVAAAVVGTGLSGLVFCWLRLRSGSLLAPIGLHLATNSVGYLTAYFVLRG